MISISELSNRWEVPYKRLNRWVKECSVGEKCGHAVVLTEEQVENLKIKLRERLEASKGKPGRTLNLGTINGG